MPTAASGYSRALAALARGGVRFVLVGVGGINFYAKSGSQAFMTLDVDALLAPTVENVSRAFDVLAELGFGFEAGGEPFVDLRDDLVIRRILERGACVAARHAEGVQIDLMTSIAGFDFASLSEDATTFEVAGTPVRVGRLEKLLASKEASGRPKDRAFLEAFESGRARDGS
jgi:predicted nucleotidyltransferase